ncbi:MAG: hypothetical protein Greene071421_228 [Parcubacteria group bacterium Greene0714_21]|nr:MAG: hypothetical protein Greene041639_306 [Parcubacteria group bacterium Greene0416_39]TSC97247.1 MAG: hypothetical protein Greene101447_569 [Parcubacteria group bacterium Greene1014_47]TSD04392.1 MAG: hypothetical protein Greene071421_228 [Parcubacteria group bacterium Greene0714_21]
MSLAQNETLRRFYKIVPAKIKVGATALNLSPGSFLAPEKRYSRNLNEESTGLPLLYLFANNPVNPLLLTKINLVSIGKKG